MHKPDCHATSQHRQTLARQKHASKTAADITNGIHVCTQHLLAAAQTDTRQHVKVSRHWVIVSTGSHTVNEWLIEHQVMHGLKGTQADELVTDVICYEQMSLPVHRCRKGESLQLHIQVSRCGWKIARYMMRDHEVREAMNLQMYRLKPSNSLWLVSIHTPYPLSLSLNLIQSQRRRLTPLQSFERIEPNIRTVLLKLSCSQIFHTMPQLPERLKIPQ